MFLIRCLIFALISANAASAIAQQPPPPSDAEKRQQFLKAREEMHTLPIPPRPEATPAPKPRPKINKPQPPPDAPSPELPQPSTPPEKPSTPEPAKPESSTPPQTPEGNVPNKPAPESTPPPAPKDPKKPTSQKPTPPKAAPAKSATPKNEPKPEPKPERKPEPEPKPEPKKTTPAPSTPVPKPARVPAVTQTATPPPAPITIEKSGVEAEHGIQPAAPAGWFSRWKYLSKSVQRAIDQPAVQKGRWRYIVVHNSGTRQGSLKAFDYYHLHVRKMPNGLAYQFVIGNGSSSGDGEIEIGNRWVRQINGGHVHSDYLNNIALGICLVGDFNRDTPTKRQLEALEELTRYLRMRVGKIDHKFAIVKAHKEINPPRWPTDCPGNDFPYNWLHRKFD